jgi:hypothetical protein
MGAETRTPRRHSAAHRGQQPVGTLTLDQVRGNPAFAATPTTTLRKHLAIAEVGKWLPAGKNTPLSLYDPSRVVELAAAPPRRRGIAPEGRRRRRRRVLAAGAAHAPRGVPRGWCTLADLAAEIGEPREALRRRLEGHGRRVWRLLGGSVELRTLHALLLEERIDPGEAAHVPKRHAVVGSRRETIYDRAAALSAIRGAQPEEVAWRRWLDAVLSRRGLPHGEARDSLTVELLATLQGAALGHTDAGALGHVRRTVDRAFQKARSQLTPGERRDLRSGSEPG